MKDQRSVTPLFWACMRGQNDIALMLVLKGADLNVTDENFDTPLHIAVREGHKKIAKEIIERAKDADKLNDVSLVSLVLYIVCDTY